MGLSGDRLDNFVRPNLGQVSRRWDEIVPDDMPPVVTGEAGNCPPGTVGLYVAREGYVRFITRGAQFGMVAGAHHDVFWLNPTGSEVFLDIGGTQHRVQWLPAVPDSVRVWAADATYLWGQVVHVLAHETTAVGVYALSN